MAGDDNLEWIPAAGVHLARAELVEIMRTLRALVAGPVPDEPNGAHAVSVAYVITRAIDRGNGAS